MDAEYYSAVYSWFEKCGLISNIRTNLRHNLVSTLKNSELSIKRERIIPKSAKQYIYDLLIAEYLWNHNYFYTLSVFASEAPMLINFNNHTTKQSENRETQKLQSDYIHHTLESLGIKPSDPQGQYIVSEYANNDVPLLLCILKYSSTGPTCKDQYEEKHLVNKCIQTEYEQRSNDFDAKKFTVAKKKLLKQKESYDMELREKELRLKEHAMSIEKQIKVLNEKLKQAEKVMSSIEQKQRRFVEEKQKSSQDLFQKEVELSMREKLLEQESNRLQREKESSKIFEDNLKRLQEELMQLKKDLPNPSLKSTKDIKVQTEFDNYPYKLDKRTIDHEKQEQMNLIQEQQLRIEQLTLRAVQLSRKIEEIQLLKPKMFEVTSVPAVKSLNTNTIISESSSTEDILQDAKMRLRRLEEESLKADQYYFSCITASP